MKSFFKTVLLTGLFVGTTDLLSAYLTLWIKNGKFADKMLLYIAGGALGLESSMSGGNWVALLGLFFHYFIAFAFTLFFFWVFPKLKFLWFNKYLIGMLYAIMVSFAMEFIIQFFTPLPSHDFNLSNSIIGWVSLGIVFGIPISYNTYKYYGVESDS